jgi:hypothetical protein
MTLFPDLMADDSGGWINGGALVPTLNTLMTWSTDYVVMLVLTQPASTQSLAAVVSHQQNHPLRWVKTG